MNAFFDEAALEKRHRANMSSRLLSLLWTNSSFGLYQRLLSVSTLESEIHRPSLVLTLIFLFEYPRLISVCLLHHHQGGIKTPLPLPFPALAFYSGPRRRMPACLAELILAVSPLSHSVKMDSCVSLAGLSPAIVRTTQSNCQASGWEILLETDFHQRR